jgi:hypothetical protein
LNQEQMKKTVLAGLLWLQLAGVSAEPLSDADFCRNGLFPREQEQLSMGVIQGATAEKVHFFDDLDGCPSKGASCMRAAYLIPGDQVVVGKSTAGWACVWYQGRKHESVSWVPRKNVALLPASADRPAQGLDRHLGGRSGQDPHFPVKREGRTPVRVEFALARRDAAERRADRASGRDGGRLQVDGSKAGATDGDCQVRLTRIGSYLVADDNGACGGMNVRHTGMYLRPAKTGQLTQPLTTPCRRPLNRRSSASAAGSPSRCTRPAGD